MKHHKSRQLISFTGSQFILSSAAAVALCGFSGPVYSQRPEYPIQSGNTQHFGSVVADVGDIDLDGTSDFAVGAPGSKTLGGAAYVYSGKSRALMYTFSGRNAGDGFGISVCGAGDVNNDGHRDIIVGAFDSMPSAEGAAVGYACVYSGADGTLLLVLDAPKSSKQFGWKVLGVGDIDGDKHDDVAVSDPMARYAPGAITLFSGATGQAFRSIEGDPENSTSFGFSIALAGDFNRDGVPELIVGAPEGRTGTPSKPTGYVRVVSLANGETIRTIYGAAEAEHFGIEVAGSIDVDADQVNDIIVGAPHAGAAYEGAVRVFSGANGKLVHEVVGTANFRIGEHFDVAARGVIESAPVLITDGTIGDNIHIYSLLVDGSKPLHVVSDVHSGFTKFGQAICMLSATNSAFIVGAPFDANVGAVWLVSTSDVSALQLITPPAPDPGSGSV